MHGDKLVTMIPAITLSLLIGVAATGSATEPFPLGELVDPVPTIHESGETFTLYLPTGYTPDRKWPILFVLDPRSRGRMAAELFQAGAERFGYILISSNSTRSDSLPGENPNPTAMVALLQDAMTRFAADERRVYLAGFSGTARYAWSVGFGIRDQVAGIIACGGALPGPLEQWEDVTFHLFGSAGETDFNYREMRFLDDALDATEIRHRFAFHPGGHRWAPPAVLTEALAWFELQAIRDGTREDDAELVAQLHAAGVAVAQEMETRGDLYGAFRFWEQLAMDFDGLLDISVARRNAARLGKLPAVQDEGAAIHDAVAQEIAYRQRLDAVLARIANQTPPPPLPTLVDQLDIPRLLKQAEEDSVWARSAQRKLESAFVHTAFYQPRRLLRSGHVPQAVLTLKLATAIKPDHWRPWYFLATTYAEAGRRSKAVDALERAVAAGYQDLEAIEQDSKLDGIRDEKGYRRLMQTLRRQPSS